jgi:hypothetical protein
MKMKMYNVPACLMWFVLDVHMILKSGSEINVANTVDPVRCRMSAMNYEQVNCIYE